MCIITEKEIKSLLFFDIETVGYWKTFAEVSLHNPRLAELWAKRAQWLREAYPDTNANMTTDELWQQKTGLHPEFGRIVCISFGYYNQDMIPMITSYYGHDEVSILRDTKKLMEKVFTLGWTLCGHTIKRFDVPFTGKRMVINKIKPPALLQVSDKKPWEIKFKDIAEMWSFGAYQESHTSLDLMSCVMDVRSPKEDLNNKIIHHTYYDGDTDDDLVRNIERIKAYCENDIRATMEVVRSWILED
jgi:3'-5' exonuclease